jgi:hypothetical protein
MGKRLLDQNVNNPYWFVWLVWSLADTKRFDEAEAIVRKFSEGPDFDRFTWLQMKASVEIAEGKPKEARTSLREMEAMVEAGTGIPSTVFPLYLRLGDLDRGAAWFEQGYAARDSNIILPDNFVPEQYSSDPAFLARFDKPGMKELFEIRRKNKAKNSEAGP